MSETLTAREWKEKEKLAKEILEMFIHSAHINHEL